MFSEWVLGIWSLAGIVWWLIALGLVRAEAQRPKLDLPREPIVTDGETISIFKPLPPLGPSGLDPYQAGLESFVAELDAGSEMLLGIHEADRLVAEPFLNGLRTRFPQTRLIPVYRSGPDEVANPKIAWQKILAPHAQGEIWLWSDADVVAPPGSLARARAEFAGNAAGMLTFPYVVRGVHTAPALLDALFVNAEFYPGVLLLRKKGLVDFGLGAGMLFRKDLFFNKAGWDELGASLADDFVLGQKLAPVCLSATTLEITPGPLGWGAALSHHWRWSRTVWWNRPFGAAARIIVLPVAGWLLCAGFHPTLVWPWLGLLAMMQVDVASAFLLCRAVGCRWKAGDWLLAQCWVYWRLAVWLACWFPIPVLWAGRRWHGPKNAMLARFPGDDIDKD